VKKLWALAGGTMALAVLTVGVILWNRTATPGSDALLPAPGGPALAKTTNTGPSKGSPPSVPTLDPKSSGNRIPSKSTSDGSTNSSLSRLPADMARQPKSELAVASQRLRLLVPVYIYPAGDGLNEWQRLINAASKVQIVAIVNPNSGPGDERNLDYAAVFTEAKSHGITLVGYISTNYGKRPKADVRKDIDTWIRFYPQIRGFFFDQQPPDGRDAAKFVELRDYAKQKFPDSLVITNPGVLCDAMYLALAVSNVTCVFANFQGFDQFELPPKFQVYDPSRFAALPYNISNADTMRTMVKDAIIKRIGYLYVSDARPPVLWDKLPVYWEEEVDAVSHLR
jgi:hypothetical protein